MKLKWITAIVIIFGSLTMFYVLRWPTVLKTSLILSSVILIGTVLLQAGKGGGLAAIGGLEDQSAMGTRTGGVLTKITYLLGASFIFTTILLTKLTLSSIHGTGTMGRGAPVTFQETAHDDHAGHDHAAHEPSQQSTQEIVVEEEAMGMKATDATDKKQEAKEEAKEEGKW
ncbi:MAG: preprotein translocase subunit SecG [Candidatus Scalindua sp.]